MLNKFSQPTGNKPVLGSLRRDCPAAEIHRYSYMKKRIEKALFAALDLLLRADGDILEIDINERTILHRLANYLEPHFPGWNVDCEYNRNHDDPKRLDIQRRDVRSDDTQATTVFPDIIVHKRGTNKNLLVIEIKKTTSREHDNYDLGKLRAFRQQLGYRFAVFVKLKTDGGTGIDRIEWL